jgi:transcriptional regulator with XRE-family HTH domain
MESRPDLQGLGAFIRERRHALGLTQRQLGQRIDWVQERVSLLERGGYGLPSVIILARLARALDSPLSDLLAALGYEESSSIGVGRAERESAHAAALLYTLEQFLTIRAVELATVMDQTSDVAARVMGADMVEVFLYQADSLGLAALGSSRTGLAQRQRELGLDHVSLASDGRIVEVFQRGEAYATGHAERDQEIRRGLREELGIRSLLASPIQIDGRPHGVLVAESIHPERFSEDERHFFSAVAHWVGLMAQRAELIG